MVASPPGPAHASRIEIDTIRAIACVALVSYHAVGSSAASGLELAPGHWLSLVNTALVDLRMPLFSFVSGYVFAAMQRGARLAGPPWRAILSKARRLLLPMACVGTLFWLAREAAGQDQQSLASIFVTPFAHFWFLQATFLIMTVFMLLTWLSGGRNVVVALGAGLLALLAWVTATVPATALFSGVAAIHLGIFFMAGHLWAAWARRMAPDAAPGAVPDAVPFGAGRAAAMALVAVALGIGTVLALGLWAPEGGTRRAVGVAVGLVFCAALFTARPQQAGLAWLGRHSYAIYLFHVFFTAGTREILNVAAPGLDAATLWLVTLAAGLAGPIALQLAILRVPGASLPLLGVVRRRPADAARHRDVPSGPLHPGRPATS